MTQHENLQVRHNEAESRFEVDVDGALAAVDYDLEPGRIVLTHTEVPQQLGGRGIAGQLVRTALDHARAQKLVVVPQCAYVASFIKKNPQYQDLVGTSE
jgi:predicted GNAT family acetyltransferase